MSIILNLQNTSSAAAAKVAEFSSAAIAKAGPLLARATAFLSNPYNAALTFMMVAVMSIFAIAYKTLSRLKKISAGSVQAADKTTAKVEASEPFKSPAPVTTVPAQANELIGSLQARSEALALREAQCQATERANSALIVAHVQEKLVPEIDTLAEEVHKVVNNLHLARQGVYAHGQQQQSYVADPLMLDKRAGSKFSMDGALVIPDNPGLQTVIDPTHLGGATEEIEMPQDAYYCQKYNHAVTQIISIDNAISGDLTQGEQYLEDAGRFSSMKHARCDVISDISFNLQSGLETLGVIDSIHVTHVDARISPSEIDEQEDPIDQTMIGDRGAEVNLPIFNTKYGAYIIQERLKSGVLSHTGLLEGASEENLMTLVARSQLFRQALENSCLYGGDDRYVYSLQALQHLNEITGLIPGLFTEFSEAAVAQIAQLTNSKPDTHPGLERLYQAQEKLCQKIFDLQAAQTPSPGPR